MERIQCKFFWGGDDNRRRYHLVNWMNAKKPLDRGDWVLDLWWR